MPSGVRHYSSPPSCEQGGLQLNVGVDGVILVNAYAEPIRRPPGSDWPSQDRRRFCLGDGISRGWTEKTLRNDSSCNSTIREGKSHMLCSP